MVVDRLVTLPQAIGFRQSAIGYNRPIRLRAPDSGLRQEKRFFLEPAPLQGFLSVRARSPEFLGVRGRLQPIAVSLIIVQLPAAVPTPAAVALLRRRVEPSTGVLRQLTYSERPWVRLVRPPVLILPIVLSFSGTGSFWLGRRSDWTQVSSPRPVYVTGLEAYLCLVQAKPGSESVGSHFNTRRKTDRSA